MPIFEYDCDSCKVRFEDLVGTLQNYPEPVQCPHCYSLNIAKVVSAPGLVVVPFSGGADEKEALKNKAWLERPDIAKQIQSGERAMTMTGPVPSRLQPKFS